MEKRTKRSLGTHTYWVKTNEWKTPYRTYRSNKAERWIRKWWTHIYINIFNNTILKYQRMFFNVYLSSSSFRYVYRHSATFLLWVWYFHSFIDPQCATACSLTSVVLSCFSLLAMAEPQISFLIYWDWTRIINVYKQNICQYLNWRNIYPDSYGL